MKIGCGASILLVLPMLILSVTAGHTEEHEKKALNPDTITRITYENSPGIIAARHKLESAKYNFKLFEAEFTQFTPFLSSEARRKSGNVTSGEVSAGIEREFFDGSSLSLEIGNETDRTPGETSHTQFVEAQIEFPLFSSNQKLSRIIKRTFEENELYSTNLEYVKRIREDIRNALEHYYDFIPRFQALETIRQYRDRLIALADEEWVRRHPADRQQIEDEISSLDSEVKGAEVRVSSAEIQLQERLGVESLEGYRIEPLSFGLGEDDYFGRYYVDESYEVILERALANDTEIKVLHSIIENAREKVRLAERGKWDMSVSTGGRYDYTDFRNNPDRDYSVSVGFDIKRFDSEVLDYSRLKAEADILNLEARIRSLKRELKARIQEKKGELEIQRKQLESLKESLQSRSRIYASKRARYFKGEESVDNLIQSFRSLLETETNFYWVGNRCFDNIRDLDNLCGVCFEKLGIEVK